MNKGTRRKILIGIDSSPGSLHGLTEAAEIAAHMDAEIVGIFVEDENLMRLAQLPHSSEVGLRSATSRNLDPDTIARLFKQMAATAQREFTLAAEKFHIRHSFKVVRGSVIGQLLEEMGSKSENSRPRRIGSSDPPPTILLMQGKICVFPAGKSVIVLDDGHHSTNRLPVALDLADHSCCQGLLFLIITPSLINARRQMAKVHALLDREQRQAEIKLLHSLEIPQFMSLLENHACGTLIFSACQKLADRHILRPLIDSIDYPVFLISK